MQYMDISATSAKKIAENIERRQILIDVKYQRMTLAYSHVIPSSLNLV